jgi:kynureninase
MTGASALRADDLFREPNPLAPHYSRFRVAERLLLTGHSHQAWPDCALIGQLRAWEDAAERVDAKWERAFEMADRVRQGYGRLLDDDPGNVALGQSTHELVVRFLSALPLRERRRVVTTTGEFHTVRRQLDRLEEEGLEVHRVPAEPADTLAERLAGALDDRTAALLVSSVLFESARIVPGLERVAAACRARGVRLLVDAYHHLNVVPFSVREMDLEDAFVVGGGYKYCQLGEGNAFLRFPPDTLLRPVITGWFAEFDATIGGERAPDRVAYGPGATRFAGATYDPTSHYRAAEVFGFFREHGLGASLLREVSLRQVGLLARAFDALDADPALISRDRSTPLPAVAGFLALRTPHAGTLVKWLADAGIHADHRAGILRLGPAPYLNGTQLEDAVAGLGEAVGRLPKGAA